MFSEKDRTSNEVNNLHKSMKEKVGKLRELEHQPGIGGFELKPMTGAEAKMIHGALGYRYI